jgi:hypothetical protein
MKKPSKKLKQLQKFLLRYKLNGSPEEIGDGQIGYESSRKERTSVMKLKKSAL